jgi:putative ABC transport system substrate-binding protein
LRPDLIVLRGTLEALAVKQAGIALPVVFTGIADPVDAGIVASLARPDSNFTGLSSFVTELEAKRVELLHEMVPGMKPMAKIGDFSNPAVMAQLKEFQVATRLRGIEARQFDIRNAADIVSAFERASSEQIEAMELGVDSVTRTHQQLIVELARRHRMPVIYASREFVIEEGGLITYGVSYPQLYLRAASFVDKIFKGARASDLPVELPAKS